MSRVYLRLLLLALVGSGLAPLIVVLASRYMDERAFPWSDVPVYALIALGIVVLGVALRRVLQRFEPRLDAAAARQASFLAEGLPERWVGVAILTSAGLSLFLELMIIRWQGTIFPFFAFYKNLSLLSCFAGLGLGYAIGGRGYVPLFLTLPTLCWQFLFMTGMRYGLSSEQFQSLYVFPFPEQLSMGLPSATHFYYGLQTYYVLAVVFVLTALAFVPIGQLCGSLMERREELTAYGFNLLGSLAGVLMTFVVSAFWTPPTIWFLVAFTALVWFYPRHRSALAQGAAWAAFALLILAWPVSPIWQKIYSPYQLLEVGRNHVGLMEIRAAGHYYQRVYDLADDGSVPDSRTVRKARNYYDLPYKIRPAPMDVAVVGSGTGNDVAAALRGDAQHVDAIEIDPAILMLGADGHPEHPYQDPRVRSIATDARSFLRTTDQRYDLIVFGLLDSHTLLSSSSSVRLDSFVYTVEAMREARERLKPDGMLSLTFAMLNDQIGRKIYLMLQQAFDGQPPTCIQIGYNAGVAFLISPGRQLTLPPSLLSEAGLTDVTATYADPALRADVSTDDWPFFYMPERIYPLSYLVMVALVLALSLLLISSFLPERPHARNFPFFLLGAGFMLVETKGITELGLTFGNSWEVIGVVIAGIMVMAFFANWVVQRLAIRNTALPFALLMASLALGWWVAKSGGLPSTWTGRIGTAALLTLPMFFSGIVFSTLLKLRGQISGVMSANLFGGMCGGLLEYNSMYFGFQFLYLMAVGLYLLAFVWEIVGARFERALAAPIIGSPSGTPD